MAKSKKRRSAAEVDVKPRRKKSGKSSRPIKTAVAAKAPGKRKRPVLRTPEPETPTHDLSFTQNREESWLRFDARVLDEALDETVPLFERLKFVSIFGSNLDEWFMVRIGGLSDLALLKRQPHDTRSGMTPSEQIDNALSMLPKLIERQAAAFTGIEANLAGSGLTRVNEADLTDADLRKVARHFETRIAPIISPMIVDPRHPFPNLKNGRLYVACSLDGTDEKGLLGLVEVPHSLDRVVELPSSPHNFRYMLVEDVILSRLSECFGSYVPTSSAVIRVTRNADVDPDGDGIAEDSDYRAHMKKVLKKRLRLQAVRLEVEGALDADLERFVIGALHLTDSHVFHTSIPLDLGYVFSLEGKAGSTSEGKLLFEPFEPQRSPFVDDSRPMREQVEERDILLCYPYESMNPLLRLLREASSDKACISIKVTLYRVASQSKLCESLIAAVENGKEVTVLMELRARFDEANNIAWAERLENAGCTVIYGSEGFKCHSKICQITYHDPGAIRRITCLGTGNFNEKTARLYSDYMLLTAHEGIGEDGNTFFRNLSLGNLFGNYHYLGVAPVGLKPLVMRGLDREIARARVGEPAFVFMKMNSLTDRDVIDKIAEACASGVPVVMIVRGITCIRANVPGKTEGLVIRQIVGRFLEHTRIYAFGADADTLYLSSADMMTRNTEHRVEIAYPVLDDTCRQMVVRFVNLQLADNAKARQLTSKGTWEKVEQRLGDPLIVSQELMLALAYRRASEPAGDAIASFIPGTRIVEHLPADILRRIASIPTSESLFESETTEDPEGLQADEAESMPEAPVIPAQEAEYVEAAHIDVEIAASEVAQELTELSGEPADAPETEAVATSRGDVEETSCVPPVQAGQESVPAPTPSLEIPTPSEEAVEAEEPEAQTPAIDESPSSAEADASADDETTYEPPATSPVEPAPDPEPVEAHIIPEETEGDAAPEDAGDPVTVATTALAPRKYGRFRMGFRLIVLGLKAIFTGRYPGKED